jgi:hypothetical protein
VLFDNGACGCARDPVGRARALRWGAQTGGGRKMLVRAWVALRSEEDEEVVSRVRTAERFFFSDFEKVPCFVTTMDGRRMWVWSNYT